MGNSQINPSNFEQSQVFCSLSFKPENCLSKFDMVFVLFVKFSKMECVCAKLMRLLQKVSSVELTAYQGPFDLSMSTTFQIW